MLSTHFKLITFNIKVYFISRNNLNHITIGIALTLIIAEYNILQFISIFIRQKTICYFY